MPIVIRPVRHAAIAALLAVPLAGAAGAGAEHDSYIAVFVDVLPDESDLTISTGLFTSTLDDQEWDTSYRIGIEAGGQGLIAEAGGPFAAYALALAYSTYETDDGSEEIEAESIMLTPRVGIGVHAGEFVLLEASGFGGLGGARFDFRNAALGIDEESDIEFAYEFGVFGSAAVALGETFLLGARVGWIRQHLEGDFDEGGGETEIDSDTEGMFYGGFAGLRF